MSTYHPDDVTGDLWEAVALLGDLATLELSQEQLAAVGRAETLVSGALAQLGEPRPSISGFTAGAHPSERRGPHPPEAVLITPRPRRSLRPLATIDAAAAHLGEDARSVREAMYTGVLPRYDLGRGLLRTRMAGLGETPQEDLVTADAAADYLGVDKKWIYNHLGELPHCVLNMAKSFSLSELDWYLETYRRRATPRNAIPSIRAQ